MLVKYLPTPSSAFPFQLDMNKLHKDSIQLPSMSQFLAATNSSTTTSSSPLDASSFQQSQAQQAGIFPRAKFTFSKEDFLAATAASSASPPPSSSSPNEQQSSHIGPMKRAGKLSLSREGLPYDAQGGATMMLSMREALSQFSQALEHAPSRQDQADIYYKRANLYYKYGLHAEALRDCNNSYYCFPSPNVVQLRNVISKKFQAAQYEFNETGINILKEKLQHAMQERTKQNRQC